MHSPIDPVYNCIAFAADDLTQKWDGTHIPFPGYYWPPGATAGDDIDALRSAFEAIGYEVCPDESTEVGFEKVVLFASDDGTWTHAAKQCDEGRGWKSKIGELEDILHQSLRAVSDGDYGQPEVFMRRRLLS